MLRTMSRIIGLGVATAMLFTLGTLKLVGQVTPEQGHVSLTDNVPLTFTRVAHEFELAQAVRSDEMRVTSELVSGGAHRGDGSWAMAMYGRTEDGTPHETRVIEDLREARRMILDSVSQSRTTHHVSDETVQNQGRRPACEGEAESSILGYNVMLRTTPPVPFPLAEGQVRFEKLYAPELGCLEMESRTIVIYSDGTEQLWKLERVVDVRESLINSLHER
jgi:hypothetical protein